MRQTPANDYLEEISTELPEELYGRLSDAIYETVCEFDEEVAQLKAENAKLRELCADLYSMRDRSGTYHVTVLQIRLDELGVEVEP